MGTLGVFRRLRSRRGLGHATRWLANYVLIPGNLKWPVHGRAERKNLAAVLRGGQWGGVPFPNTFSRRFTERFAALHTARFGILTTNGTTALYAAYRAAGLRRGDEIIVPALTFSATASAALEQGIRPVFVDVDPRTMCIDVEAARKAITPATKAIVPVHLGAQMADMDALLALGRERGVAVIEDCAHAHGARWGDRGAGSLGILGCFSFQSTKLLTAGEGGLILTNDEALAARCRSYVNFGREAARGGEPQSLLGSNSRMTDLQAAVLLAQLDRLADQTRRRDAHARLLTRLLASVEGVEVLRPHEKVTTQAVYGYYFRYMKDACGGVPRGEFIRELQECGIPAIENMYVPVYRAPEFGWRDAPIEADYSNESCPVADRAASEQLVWIQHRAFLGNRAYIEWMAETIGDIVSGYRAGRR